MKRAKANILVVEDDPAIQNGLLDVLVFNGSYDPSAVAGRCVLSAEVVKEAVSLHIRQSTSGWISFRLSRDQGPGYDQLMVQEVFGATAPGLWIKYETYWKRTTQSSTHPVFAPFASRFAGFERRDQE